MFAASMAHMLLRSESAFHLLLDVVKRLNAINRLAVLDSN
jgi:hypothetical protein